MAPGAGAIARSQGPAEKIRLAKSIMFCFCSTMAPSNDNRPQQGGCQVIRILGQVGRDGRILGWPPRVRRDSAVAPRFPNDPREA